MEKKNTSARLKEIMLERNLRQVDILEQTLPFCQEYGIKMNKSDISQYVSGKVEPNQDKLFVLSLSLNVSEGWLMGFDVPKTRSTASSSPISLYEKRLIDIFRSLNDEGQEKVLEYIDDLTASEKYIKSDSVKLVEKT